MQRALQEKSTAVGVMGMNSLWYVRLYELDILYYFIFEFSREFLVASSDPTNAFGNSAIIIFQEIRT